MSTSPAPTHLPVMNALRALRWKSRTAAGRRLRGAVGTHVGHRDRNEDAFFVSARHNLITLADGMGGHPGGHIAAELAVRVLAESVSDDGHRGPASPERRRAQLLASIIRANQRIRGRRPQDPERPMATTVVALWFVDGFAVHAHVGDSRIYRLRDGVLTPLTLDHSALGEAVRAGLDPGHVEPERTHLVSRALGLADTVRPDVGFGEVMAGDRFLLCTDGLTDDVSTDEMCAMLTAQRDPELAVYALIEAALVSGAEDNVTVSVVDAG